MKTRSDRFLSVRNDAVHPKIMHRVAGGVSGGKAHLPVRMRVF